jgi:hypothetical protein
MRKNQGKRTYEPLAYPGFTQKRTRAERARLIPLKHIEIIFYLFEV